MGVGLVMALLLGAAWIGARGKHGWRGWKRALQGGASARRLAIAERLALTAHHSLHLVRLEGAEFLVVTHPQGASMISVSSQPAAFEGFLAEAATRPLSAPGAGDIR